MSSVLKALHLYKLFPTLFPFGQGDPTSTIQHHPVTLTDTFTHLIRYSDTSKDGLTHWCFASHTRFQTMTSVTSQNQNTTDANLTIEELRNLAHNFIQILHE